MRYQINAGVVPSVGKTVLKEVLIFENIVYCVKRNAKPHDLAGIQIDGSRGLSLQNS